MPLVLLDIRFTNKNVYALIFQVHAGTQAEMAGRAMFSVSSAAGDRGIGGHVGLDPKTWAPCEPVSFRPGKCCCQCLRRDVASLWFKPSQ